MILPLEQIQSTMRSLVQETRGGRWRPVRGTRSLRPGAVIHGRYRVLETLWEEGGGCLYRVTGVPNGGASRMPSAYGGGDECILGGHSGAELGRRTFQMEAIPWAMDRELTQKLFELSHPGIARVYETFTFESNSYVISGDIPGPVLSRSEAILTAEHIRDMGIELTEIVDYLHDQGLCHMSLIPSNLKLEERKPRILTLTSCTLEGNLPQKAIRQHKARDFRQLLETLEHLAAEHGRPSQDDRLSHLLVLVEELIGKDRLSGGDIQATLARLQPPF